MASIILYYYTPVTVDDISLKEYLSRVAARVETDAEKRNLGKLKFYKRLGTVKYSFRVWIYFR